MSEKALSPRFLDHLVRRCLAKEPEERWQSVSDLGSEMKWLEANGEDFAEKAAADSPGRRFALLAAVLLALTATIAYLLGTRASTIDVPNLLAAAILPPSDVTLNAQERPLVSPDGSHLAFVATEPSGESTLWVRRLDSLEPERLPGTEGAFYPFWSPDSAHIAFFARGALYRVPISGGAPQRICDAGNSRGGAWSPNGVILFTPRSEDVLYAVEEGGGEPVPLTALDPSEDIVSHRWPHFLPDGHHFLYLEWGGHPGGIYVGSLDNDMRRPLIRNATSPVFASGHLLFVRSGTLYAQPFDDEKMELTGDAIALLDEIVMDPNARHAMFSADDGTIVYRQGVGIASMYWVDRRGERLGTVTTEGLDFRDPSLSPDGSTVASCGFDSETGIPNLWLSDVSRRLSSRVTSGPKQAYFPVWSPDGEHIIFTILQRGSGDLYQVASRGGGDSKEILKSETVAIATSWSPDGQWIALYRPGANGDWDIWMLPASGDRKPEPFIRTAFDERYPQFSPDGNWVAYSSNETGRYEVYVQSFPASDFKLRVSTDGGRVARWRGDGRELYYIAEDGMLMTVPIELGASLEAAEPSALFRTPWNAKNFLNSSFYDVTSDGERFVLATPAGDPSPGFRLLLNWKQVVARQSSP